LLHFISLWIYSKLNVIRFPNMIPLLTLVIASFLYLLCPGSCVPIIDLFPPSVWQASKCTHLQIGVLVRPSLNVLSVCIETHLHLIWFSLCCTSFGKCSHCFTFYLADVFSILVPVDGLGTWSLTTQVSFFGVPLLLLQSVNTQMNVAGTLMSICALLWVYVHGGGWLELMTFQSAAYIHSWFSLS